MFEDGVYVRFARSEIIRCAAMNHAARNFKQDGDEQQEQPDNDR
jgi:hypothetical protein